MAAESAKIVDLQAYRETRRKMAEPTPPSPVAIPFNGIQPVMMWVPVWAFVPVMAGPWIHAQ